jgi:hypothetical protein
MSEAKRMYNDLEEFITYVITCSIVYATG